MDARRRLKGHEAIAAGLAAHGITHVYTVAGTPVHETLSACARHGIRIVGMHNQSAGAMMAAAQNYVAGRLVSALVLSAGPATINVTMGILVAHDNDLPLLVIGGRRPLEMHGKGSFQDLDAVAVFQSITRWAALVESADAIAPALARACRIAMGRRPGPVYLDVPEEALDGAATTVGGEMSPPARPDVDRDAIARVAALLRNARQPALVVGAALRWSAPFDTLARLVERLGMPFATVLYAQGYLPDDHPLCVNGIRARMLASADVVVVAGARFDWPLRYGAEIAKDATLVTLGHDERGIGGSVAPAIALDGEAGDVLRELLRALGPGAPAATTVEWCAELAAAREAHAKALAARERDDVVPMDEARLVAEVRRFLPRDAVFVVDGNRLLDTVQRHMPTYTPVSRMTPGHNGCMGSGVPFGIGAKLANPDRTVVVLTGDLAFGLCLMEMETAVRLRVPVVVVLSNNDGNMGARQQRKHYPADHPDRVTMFQPGIRYDEIVRAFGGHGELVERPEDVVPALERAAAAGVAACVHVRVRTS